jgi:hypothetical protein
MKSKTIITIVLVLFIFTSVAYLIVKEMRALAQSGPAKTCPPAGTNDAEPCCEEALFAKPPTQSSQKVVVYYFHNNFRCAKCQKFESYSDETLRAAFPDALNKGSLEWKVINIDEPANEHFVKDYQLFSKSIVVAKMQDGKQTEWKNLDKIWKLVGDKAVFVKYIQDEVNTYLGAD